MTEFVTAEDTRSPRPGVWVMLETVSAQLAHGVTPVRFAITTSTGYRAELPACLLDFCTRERQNCVRKIDHRGQHSGMSVDTWCNHIKTHCHGYHLPKAESFRDAVLATYKRR